jgi:aldose 1-epimerase
MADVILRADGLEAGLRPEAGGAFSHFADLTAGAPVDLLRRARVDFTDALDSAAYPLVPFSNRVRDGRFAFRGRGVRLQPNMPPHQHPLHGQGWRNPWTVAEASEASATLVFRHEPGDWPWAYEARLTATLAGRGLDVALACRNLSDETMPCGLGLHPFHPCDARTMLDTQARAVWTIDGDAMPVEAVPVAGRYALNDRLICGQGLDNGYDGWSGEATLRWPDKGRALRLTSRAQRLQLYSPSEGGLVAVEPVTNAIDALNRPEAEWPSLGLWLLEPGEEARMQARFQVLAA